MDIKEVKEIIKKNVEDNIKLKKYKYEKGVVYDVIIEFMFKCVVCYEFY